MCKKKEYQPQKLPVWLVTSYRHFHHNDDYFVEYLRDSGLFGDPLNLGIVLPIFLPDLPHPHLFATVDKMHPESGMQANLGVHVGLRRSQVFTTIAFT
jgi:hypothetical protein